MRSQKSRKEDLRRMTDDDNSNMENDKSETATQISPSSAKVDTPLVEENATPVKLDPSVASAKDLGTFQPSSFVSPSTSSKKNFTFNSSNIPRTKSLNC